MKRIKLTVAYDGTDYCGWQIQPNGITIEEVLNKKISKLTGKISASLAPAEPIPEFTHSEMWQFFDTKSTIPPERFAYAINQRLPEDIVIVQSEEVPEDWHPKISGLHEILRISYIEQQHTRSPEKEDDKSRFLSTG